jgi:hypothetical protein
MLATNFTIWLDKLMKKSKNLLAVDHWIGRRKVAKHGFQDIADNFSVCSQICGFKKSGNLSD